jgi:hypothetical protein
LHYKKTHTSGNIRARKRHFGDENIREFRYLLEKETWQEVLAETEVNTKFEVFMKSVLHPFDIAFPLEFRYNKKSQRNGWITQGIKVASKKMRLLNMQKKQLDLKKNEKNYITRYKMIYMRVIREAKRRENDKNILQAKNKSKTVWQIINKEMGRISPKKQDIKIIWNSKEIRNPENVAELFNVYYCKITEELLKKKGNNMPKSGNQYLKIQESTKTMFLFPVTEREVEKVAKHLKNKLSAGIDEIPDYVVKQCIKQLKKPLANIYNASLESGIFPDQLKIAKMIPVYKKGDKKDIQNYRPIALLSVFSKLLEKLVHNRLMAFTEGNGVITEAQHGFRTMKSTETAL